MAERNRLLSANSSWLLSSRPIACFDLNQGFHDLLRPIFNAVCKRTVAFCAVSENWVEAHDVTLIKFALQLVLYFDRCLSSPADAGNKELMTFVHLVQADCGLCSLLLGDSPLTTYSKVFISFSPFCFHSGSCRSRRSSVFIPVLLPSLHHFCASFRVFDDVLDIGVV